MSEQPSTPPEPEAARHTEIMDLLTQIRDRLPDREPPDSSAPAVDVDGR